VGFVIAKALLFCAAALCAASGALLSARPAAAASGCATTVINDWRDGRIDGVYSPHCYRQALRELPEDIRIYSSAEDDIQRALVASLAKPASAQKAGDVKGIVRRLASTKAKAAAQREAAQSVLASGATSVPLTVLIAGGIAVFLVAAASISVVAKRVRRLS
jgi:hypothetical protein